MKRGFVLRRVAEQEFGDSIAWYEGERAGLGQVFRAIIEEYFQRIADNLPCARRHFVNGNRRIQRVAPRG